MSILYLSNRIFLNDGFVRGGVLVSVEDGTIIKVFKTQDEVNSFISTTKSNKVRIFFFNCFLIKILNSIP